MKPWARRTLAFGDYGWEFLRRAETLQPHNPQGMFPGQIKAPPFLWVCDVCERHEYSTSSTRPPGCAGGMAFSFTTAGKEP